MRTGSAPARTAVWTRAIGVRPRAAAFSDVIISSAAAPSEICDEFPAVMMLPSSFSTVFSPASVSTDEPGRMPSSAATTVPSGRVTGAIWASNRPPACAAAARSWEVAENSSAAVRESPHRCAIISAPMI